MAYYKSRCVYWRWPTFAERFQVFFVLLAGFLLKFTAGLVNTFGNMVPYYVSYIRYQSHPTELRNVDAPMVFACQIIFVGLGVSVGGMLETRFGPRVTSLAGTVLMTLGMLSTYYTIQLSFWLSLLTYGILFAFGSGLPSVCAMVCATKWLPEWDKVISGVFLAASGIGTAMFALLQTSYINPHNYPPDNAPYLGNPSDKYFSEDELLLRVPQAFLLLGGIAGSLQFFASIFLIDPYMEGPVEAIDSSESQKLMEPFSILASRRAVTSDYTPWEMLTSHKFYLLWAMRILSWICLIYFQSLYKVFAFEEVTNNDRFLSVVRAIGAMAHVASLLLWNFLSDIVDYKFSFIMQSGLLTYLFLTFYATTMGGEVMLLFWYSLCSFGGSIYPIAVSGLFGRKYTGSNLSLLLALSVPFVFSSTFLPRYMVDHVRWYGLFFILGGVSLLQFCLALILAIS